MIAPEKLAPEIVAGMDLGSVVASLPGADANVSDQPAPPETPRPLRPGELKYRLTLLLFPSILLVFVALYVANLTAGAEPEMALLQAGGASMILAVLARVAIGIVASDQHRLSDREIVALARAGALKEQIKAAQRAGDDTDAAQAPQAGSTAGDGGKE
jgi:hypothetical protein